jgi:uncharacterized protein
MAQWPQIRRVLLRAQRSSVHCAVASVGPDGAPNVTPIGTVFLRDDGTGYFFDQYSSQLARNLANNPRVCVMAVNVSRWFWLRSFLLGRFTSPPGLRLDGMAGPLRPASPQELQAIAERVRPTRWLKGSRLLWSDFTQVRDLDFHAFRPVRYPHMMDGLWR